MSKEFENLSLPGVLIAELFSSTLIAGAPPGKAKVSAGVQTSTSIPPDVPLNFLGTNQRRFCILVSYPNDIYLPDTALDFLGNILKAAGLNLADVAIVNTSTQQLNLELLVTNLAPQHLIQFGDDASVEGLLMPKQEFSIEKASFQYFASPSLDVLNAQGKAGQLLKSKLWLCLKNMLGLK